MGRKPIGKRPMTAAQRKQEQRMRQQTRIIDCDSHEWTEADCLHVLSGKQWRGSVIDQSAWQQLGKLRGFA